MIYLTDPSPDDRFDRPSGEQSLDAFYQRSGAGRPLRPQSRIIICQGPWIQLPAEQAVTSSPRPSAHGRIANIYISDEFSFVVVSDDPRHRDHGSVHGALKDFLSLNPHKARGINSDSLADHQIAAFVDGPNISIRIEDARKCFNRLRVAMGTAGELESGRDALFRIVSRYRRAIDVALDAVGKSRGEVVLLVGGDSPEDTECRLNVAKLLGELHRVRAEAPGATRVEFVASHLESPRWGNYYYRKEQGTRYISLEQLAGLAEHVEERAIFVEGINQVSQWLKNRNRQGTQEAVLLLVDETGTALIKDSPSERLVKEQISKLAEFANQTPLASWTEAISDLRQRLAEAVRLMREGTHPDFTSDDLQNPRYIELVTNILRGHSSKMPLGAGFSTPLKAVDVGCFRRDAEGAKIFDIATTDAVQREVVDWCLSNPELPGMRADWLGLLVPLISLTPDYHPARIARSLLPQNERNFIVLTGVAGEFEHKLVVRENPYSAAHLTRVNSARLSKMKAQYSSEQLADAALEAMDAQFALINGLWDSLEPAVLNGVKGALGTSRMCVPPFIPIQLSSLYRRGDFLERPFIEGQRLDLLNRLEMSPDQMEFALRWIGKIMAVNFLAQRPAFSLHELLSVNPTSDPQSGYIRSIGASESFCNAINVKSVEQAIEKAAILYGTHLATWLMSLRFGSYGDALPADNTVDEKLIKVALQAFEEGFRQIATEAPQRFHPIVEKVRADTVAKHELMRRIPELDMSKNVLLTERLLKLNSVRQSKLLESIARVARETCECIGRVCADLPEFGDEDGGLRSVIQRGRESLIDRAYSFVENHLSGDRFSVVQDVLGGRLVDFSRYSLQERTWLLTVLDVELWMTEVGDDEERTPLWLVASSSGTEHEFLECVRERFSHACLSEKQAREFYDSVHGLEREFSEAPERKLQLKSDLRDVCGFSPPWDDSERS